MYYTNEMLMVGFTVERDIIFPLVTKDDVLKVFFLLNTVLRNEE